MRVAKKVKENYSGELLTDKQWKKRGYQPKEGELPEQMWANQECCGSGKPEKFSYPYYFDYQMEKESCIEKGQAREMMKKKRKSKFYPNQEDFNNLEKTLQSIDGTLKHVEAILLDFQKENGRPSLKVLQDAVAVSVSKMKEGQGK